MAMPGQQRRARERNHCTEQQRACCMQQRQCPFRPANSQPACLDPDPVRLTISCSAAPPPTHTDAVAYLSLPTVSVTTAGVLVTYPPARHKRGTTARRVHQRKKKKKKRNEKRGVSQPGCSLPWRAFCSPSDKCPARSGRWSRAGRRTAATRHNPGFGNARVLGPIYLSLSLPLLSGLGLLRRTIACNFFSLSSTRNSLNRPIPHPSEPCNPTGFVRVRYLYPQWHTQ